MVRTVGCGRVAPPWYVSENDLRSPGCRALHARQDLTARIQTRVETRSASRFTPHERHLQELFLHRPEECREVDTVMQFTRLYG